MAGVRSNQQSWTVLLDHDEPRPLLSEAKSGASPCRPWQLLGICDPKHPLVILADSVTWDDLVALVAKDLPPRTKWPSRSLRLVLGLVMLSGGLEVDEGQSLSNFEDSIYWQYFCGLREIQWKCGVSAAGLCRWKAMLSQTRWALLLDLRLDHNRDVEYLAARLG